MIIFLAPHLGYPPRNGGDIYIERLACYLSKYQKVVLLTSNLRLAYEYKHITEKVSFSNKMRPKTLAAIRTIVYQSHYLLERFVTDNYSKQAKALFQENDDAIIFNSLISTSKTLEIESHLKKQVIFTQNNEILWFQNQRMYSNNPLHKLVARLSEQWISGFLKCNSEKYKFVHISEFDYDGYKEVIPNHHGIIVPAGVDIIPLQNPKIPEDGIIRLLFVGSLSVKINYEALKYFKTRFLDIIQHNFKEKVKVWVAGSHPTNQVKQLCAREGWNLFADLSDEELRRIYEQASFAILPFPYTTGAKLKLLNALAVGLPVLATLNMKSLPGQEFSPNLYADSPEQWVRHLGKYKNGITIQDREACQQFAFQYSWESIADKFYEALMESDSLL